MPRSPLCHCHTCFHSCPLQCHTTPVPSPPSEATAAASREAPHPRPPRQPPRASPPPPPPGPHARAPARRARRLTTALQRSSLVRSMPFMILSTICSTQGFSQPEGKAQRKRASQDGSTQGRCVRVWWGCRRGCRAAGAAGRAAGAGLRRAGGTPLLATLLPAVPRTASVLPSRASLLRCPCRHSTPSGAPNRRGTSSYVTSQGLPRGAEQVPTQRRPIAVRCRRRAPPARRSRRRRLPSWSSMRCTRSMLTGSL